MTPTPYSAVYDIFLSQISDSVFMSVDTTDALKKRYLLNAIPRFKRCKQDLTIRDDVNSLFNLTLTDEELLILGTLTTIEYIRPQIISIELLKQAVSNKDFQITSQAAHLKQLIDLRKMLQDDANRLIVDYTYNNNDLSELS